MSKQRITIKVATVMRKEIPRTILAADTRFKLRPLRKPEGPEIPRIRIESNITLTPPPKPSPKPLLSDSLLEDVCSSSCCLRDAYAFELIHSHSNSNLMNCGSHSKTEI